MGQAGIETIYYMDRIVAKPGQAEALLNFYMKSYVPKAQSRGMALAHCWVSPPVWLKEQSNELYIIWTVNGVNAWWNATRMRRNNPDLIQFWDEALPMIASRQRLFLSDVNDVESLCRV